jgi:plasmid stabilization system protein ParE
LTADLRLLPSAEDDLAQARAWYESRRPGLGGEFLATVAAHLDRIAEGPREYPVVYRGLRRAVVRRFPYLIYFVLRSGRVTVVACLHGRRHPEELTSRAR